MELILEYSKNEKLYLTNIKYCNDILKLKNWDQINRKKDLQRVNNIKNFYKKNKIMFVPGIVHIYHTKNDYLIFDGLHRYSAAKNLDMKILICLYDNISENEVVKIFNIINKAVPLPEMYTTEVHNKNKKEFIEKIIARLCSSYPEHNSISKNCQVQNFNSDIMINLFFKLSIYNNKNYHTKFENLWKNILELNIIGKQNVEKFGIKVYSKTKKSGFYLRYNSDDFILNYINENFDKKEVNLIDL